MPKVLFVVFSCNRFYYLRNCVESIFEFVDLADAQVMVVDIAMKESEGRDYLEQLKSKAIIYQFNDRVPNELYRSMNYAINYCFEHKISYINFIQEDYQFLFQIPTLVNDIVSVFHEYKNIVQIQTNMIWRRKKIGDYKVIKHNGINYAVLMNKNPVDSGFTRVSAYKKTGLYPTTVISYDQNSEKTFGFGKNRYKKLTNGELWFGNRCNKLGYKRAVSFYPNMAMMFDCSYVRTWHRFGRYFPPPNEFYLKPLIQDEIRLVRRRNKHKKFSYIENCVKPDGWTPSTFEKHNMEKIKVLIS